jgi:hypothetical protein
VSAGAFVLSPASTYDSRKRSESAAAIWRMRGSMRATSAPGATRPTSVKLPFIRSGSIAWARQSRTPGSGNQKPRGITPTTVVGAPSSTRRVPRTAGLPPSSCHSP